MTKINLEEKIINYKLIELLINISYCKLFKINYKLVNKCYQTYVIFHSI
jgi:hypothetical protein